MKFTFPNETINQLLESSPLSVDVWDDIIQHICGNQRIMSGDLLSQQRYVMTMVVEALYTVFPEIDIPTIYMRIREHPAIVAGIEEALSLYMNFPHEPLVDETREKFYQSFKTERTIPTYEEWMKQREERRERYRPDRIKVLILTADAMNTPYFYEKNWTFDYLKWAVAKILPLKFSSDEEFMDLLKSTGFYVREMQVNKTNYPCSFVSDIPMLVYMVGSHKPSFVISLIPGVENAMTSVLQLALPHPPTLAVIPPDGMVNKVSFYRWMKQLHIETYISS